MSVANRKLFSIKPARSHNLPDDQISFDQISDTKNCGKCKLIQEDAKAICSVFILSGITLNVQILLIKCTNS